LVPLIPWQNVSLANPTHKRKAMWFGIFRTYFSFCCSAFLSFVYLCTLFSHREF
jgi:hypothetical protein